MVRRTLLSHALQVDVEPALVVDKRFVACLVRFDPITYLLAQFQVVGLGPIELIREGAKEAVAVTEGRCSVEAQCAQLLGE